MSLNVQGFNKKNKFKIMLENILKIEGLSVLNKKEQESVNGGKSLNGGTCSYIMRKYEVDGSYYEHVQTGVSQEAAINAATYAEEKWVGGNWCCASYGSASWL